MSDGQGSPAEAEPPPVRTGLLLGVLAGTSAFTLSVPPIVLPELAADLGLTAVATAWVLAGASLTMAVMTPLFGRLADLRGLQTVLALGMACTAAGAIAVLVAPSFALLVAARLLQGAGATGITLAAVGIASARLSGARRARALGVLTAEASVALGAGALLGAGTAALLDWRWALALPAVALPAWAAVRALAPPAPARSGAVDLRGATAALVLGSAVTALLQARATGLPAPAMVALVAVAVVAGCALAASVRARSTGVLPHALLQDRRFLALSLAGGALFAGYMGMAFAAPLLLHAGREWSPMHVGVILLPTAALAALAADRAGALAGRLPAEHLLMAAAVAQAGGLLLAAAGAGHAVAVVLGAAGGVCGFAVAQVVILDALARSMPVALGGIAVGTFNFIFVTGGAVGVAAAGAIAEASTVRAAVACLALVPLAGALVVRPRANRVPTLVTGPEEVK